MPQLLKETQPVARKAHRCSSCSIEIPPGTRYRRSTNLYDGQVYDWLTCVGCEGLTSVVWDWAGQPDEGVIFDDFDEWAHETDTPEAAAWLARRGCTCNGCDPEGVSDGGS